MKIFIQLSLLIFVGVLTPVFIGLLFLVTPIIWLVRKVDNYIGNDATTVVVNESETVNNSAICDKVLWSS